MKLQTAALCCLLLSSSVANALTGADLYRDCTSEKKNVLAQMACLAYVRGISEGLKMGLALEEEGNPNNQKFYCPPTFDPEQAKLVIEKYLRDHPESFTNRQDFWWQRL